MELRRFAYFVAVAEEGNITRAAGRLHVAQPGVSAQLRRLERELGAELLDRSGRGIRLTEAGAAVLPYARAALAAAEGARLAVEELTGLLRGRVAVATVTSHTADLPGLLADFHRRHPAVEITLSEGASDTLVDGVRTGRLDAAVVSVGAEIPGDLAYEVVDDQPIVAAVAPGHPLAASTGVTPAGLLDHPLICLPPGTGVRARLDEACAAAGVSPRIALEAGDPSVVAELAARGLGTAVLPGIYADTHASRLWTLPITTEDGAELRGRLAFVWRAGGPTGPAGRALVRRAREHLRAGTGTA
ncbi:LysR family transcriptional regulator [Streptomyces zingiberis]|uniref:LysR family transcriptional regulator n=1 Tax=Streptomyces zingiberis TaxID=2053010 RepID=A0ABX1BYZ8_9ACTN|nr:LysR family transcriptional regulator [Streptomyces zingiberis]NJQ01700.1 LysR family transcriptional regulator [Streptomyces zingiberis]